MFADDHVRFRTREGSIMPVSKCEYPLLPDRELSQLEKKKNPEDQLIHAEESLDMLQDLFWYYRSGEIRLPEDHDYSLKDMSARSRRLGLTEASLAFDERNRRVTVSRKS
ncbi:hypothetical protein RCL1_007215 [Eukaryota sp. TZLM3-RCL]